MSQARELDHSYVGTEHLLLGLLAERKGIAAQVLMEAGVTLADATAETVNVLGTERPPSEQESTVRHRVARQASSGSLTAVAQPGLSERIRDVMRDAEDVATECGTNELMPIHVAIALVRNGEGFANAVLDRLNVDRPALTRALTEEARSDEPGPVPGVRLEFGKYMVAFQRQVESESRWRHSPPTTLNILLALLDNVKEVALIFETQGIDANRVRNEARKMSG
jgi:ATP-dependent Clp protease ATP-binding subunit ClpA